MQKAGKDIITFDTGHAVSGMLYEGIYKLSREVLEDPQDVQAAFRGMREHGGRIVRHYVVLSKFKKGDSVFILDKKGKLLSSLGYLGVLGCVLVGTSLLADDDTLEFINLLEVGMIEGSR